MVVRMVVEVVVEYDEDGKIVVDGDGGGCGDGDGDINGGGCGLL